MSPIERYLILALRLHAPATAPLLAGDAEQLREEMTTLWGQFTPAEQAQVQLTLDAFRGRSGPKAPSSFTTEDPDLDLLLDLTFCLPAGGGMDLGLDWFESLQAVLARLRPAHCSPLDAYLGAVARWLGAQHTHDEAAEERWETQVDGLWELLDEDERYDARRHLEQLLGALRFRVSMGEVRASNGTSWVVCLDRPDRPVDAKPWDPGRITPFESSNKEHVENEVQEWTEFFDVGEPVRRSGRVARLLQRMDAQAAAEKAAASDSP